MRMGKTQSDTDTYGGWVDQRAAGRILRSMLSLEQVQTYFVIVSDLAPSKKEAPRVNPITRRWV